MHCLAHREAEGTRPYSKEAAVCRSAFTVQEESMPLQVCH
jgi:hypothetical protein